ncbi:MAG: hypothetical protein Q9191_008492, partial [Dirinaria sp. TL-2023a]
MSAFEPPEKAVALSVESTVPYIEKANRPNMAKQVFEKFDECELTDTMLKEAARLFNGNYEVWGRDATNSRSTPKPGKPHEVIPILSSDIWIETRVRLSKDRLRAQYLPHNASCSYLVVHSDFRERELAANLLNQLRQDNDTIYDLMSSHPAACLAAAKAFGNDINAVTLDFIRDNADAIMKVSPVEYVKNAKLRDSLFDPQDISGAIS